MRKFLPGGGCDLRPESTVKTLISQAVIGEEASFFQIFFAYVSSNNVNDNLNRLCWGV